MAVALVVGINMATLKFAAADTATYYVSPTGSDTNSGTIDAPWQTVRKGIISITPGSTLILRGGTYVENIQNASIKPGTPDMPITVKAMAGERPVVQGLLWLNNPSYWTLDGINVTWQNSNTSDEHMAKVSGGIGWRWTNSEIWGAHSYAGLLIAGTPSDWTVDHDVIHDTYASNDTNQDHLIYANAGMGKGTIEHSVFYNSPNGRGIKIGPPSGDGVMGNVTIRYNSFYNNLGPSNIQLSGGATGNTIYHNIFQKPGPKRTAITVNSLSGTNNVYKDNIAWDTPRMADPTTQLVDGGGNQLLDPGYVDALNGNLRPTNSLAADYGAFANEVQVVTPPTPPIIVDTTAPTVALQAPAADGTVAGTVKLSATATDDMAIASVSFYANDQLLSAVTAAPYAWDWGTTTIPDGVYAIKAVAKDAAGNIATSQPVRLTVSNMPVPVPDTPPTSPSGVTASNVTWQAATISWSAASDDKGVAGYRVYRDGVQVADVTALSYTDTGLSPTTSYNYTVVAYDASGHDSSPSTELSVITISGPDTAAPSVPAGLVATNVTTTSLALSWAPATDNIGVIEYTVFRNGGAIGNATGTTFVDSGLTPATQYVYSVKAADAAGNSSAASTGLTAKTLTPPDTTPPSVPTGLKLSASTQTTMTLGWTASTDISGIKNYTIYRSGVAVGTSITTGYNDTGLTAAKAYIYTVSASDTAGNTSAQSAPLTVTTLAPPAIALHGMASAATPGAAQLLLGRPANTAVSDVLLATIDARNDTTITAPGGWNLVRSDAMKGSMVKATYYHVATSADTSSVTYTWKFSGGSRAASGVVAAYANVDPASPILASSGQSNTSSSTTLTAPSVTSTATSGMLVAVFGIATKTTATPPAGMTELTDVSQPSGTTGSTSEFTAKAITVAGATGQLKATAAKSAQSIGQTILLKTKP